MLWPLGEANGHGRHSYPRSLASLGMTTILEPPHQRPFQNPEERGCHSERSEESAVARPLSGPTTTASGRFRGFARTDCDRVTGDGVTRGITWRGSSDVGKLSGKPVKLGIRLHKAKLYAFGFERSRP